MTTTPTPASGAADLLAMVSKALREAYNLGQRYWQQADSEYISQHKKADDTRAKFLALVEETCAALAAGQATAAQPAAEASRFGSPELQAMIIARCVEKDQAESVYAFRRKGLEDFCTCDEVRYEELSNKPHLFETRVFYTAPQPSPTAQSADSVQEDAAREARRLFDAGWKAAALFCDREDVVADGIIGFGACPQFEAAFSAAHGSKGGQHG